MRIPGTGSQVSPTQPGLEMRITYRSESGKNKFATSQTLEISSSLESQPDQSPVSKTNSMDRSTGNENTYEVSSLLSIYTENTRGKKNGPNPNRNLSGERSVSLCVNLIPILPQILKEKILYHRNPKLPSLRIIWKRKISQRGIRFMR